MPLEPRGTGTALVVHAHPDDEVFATGAATLALGHAGWRVVLRIATGGEAAEHPAVGETEARRLRLAKLSRSCELLTIAEYDWLTEPGQWVDRGGAQAGTLARAQRSDVVDAVRQALAEVRPALVLTVGSDGLTGHPDHVAMSAAVREAVRSDKAISGSTYGARVRAADVAAAHAELARLLAPAASEPELQIGSGRMVGAGAEIALTEIGLDQSGRAAATADVAGSWIEERRRAALDVYESGLGTRPLADVVAGRRRQRRPPGDRHLALTESVAEQGRLADLVAEQGRLPDLIAQEGPLPDLIAQEGSPPDVAQGRRRLGDSVILRAVFDLAGWQRDFFELL
ncbi:PIG-L deacetylase family protein [Kribbella flavida]|nr:PIG-L family deacetylase [Kribbella flavida]